MNSGHLILTIGALMLLLTSLLSINRILLMSDEDLSAAQTDMLAMSLTSSYLDLARGMAYDRLLDTTSYLITDPSVFVPSGVLGPDSTDEDTLTTFSDIDDFDGYELEIPIRASDQRYKSRFAVHYVTDANPDQFSSTQTFLKRIDVQTWRTYPPAPKTRPPDTLKAFVVLSYDDLN
ncbi:MAG: hypothetical protein HY961_16990 [Ignavibacteriae bacterium]|nr:hypothetical protein [Ignavibacteriota bacterium]